MYSSWEDLPKLATLQKEPTTCRVTLFLNYYYDWSGEPIDIVNTEDNSIISLVIRGPEIAR